MELPLLSVSEFVGLVNQTFALTMNEVMVEGEISGYTVSKGKWVYFSINDEESSVKCFTSVFKLQFAVEDGMKVKLRGRPNMHNKYGFSLVVEAMTPSGEGELKKALEISKKKLTAEGLFAPERKRPLPDYPEKIGLVTSLGAAAYTDVLDILALRWPLASVVHVESGVQGDTAPPSIVKALDTLNEMAKPVDVVLLVRGGGSLEDLAAFSAEEVVRAVARSRIPVVSGIGHERDESLADLAADVKANTPTDAAQRSTPDTTEVQSQLNQTKKQIIETILNNIERYNLRLDTAIHKLISKFSELENWLESASKRLNAYDPRAALKRGYSILRDSKMHVLTSVEGVKVDAIINTNLSDGMITSKVENVKKAKQL